jgi:hypothetical protein
LIFTCKRLLEKANDATGRGGAAVRRKRTLKMQMKTRESHSISDDASNIKHIDDLMKGISDLKKLN